MALRASVWLLLSTVVCSATRYEPTWKSLDSRPLPGWYDDAKFGIFIHWGVFSVPSFGSEWFWNYWKSGKKAEVDFMKKNYPPGFTYADFASQFTAELYDPDHWADVFKAAGAKYVVLTSKHHEGFCNWPTNVSFNWNAMEVGPKRDLLGDLAKSIRKRTDIHFGLYHSLFEWYNPMYLQDHANNFKTRYFVERKTMPELYELVNTYRPDVVWSDGDAGPVDYWNSTGFLAWLYNDSPVKDTVVTNDRWGAGTACKHGGYYTCHDRYNPGTKQNHKWENCMTIDKSSWGYRRNSNLDNYMTAHQLISTLAETVSCGGNLLMNIGPTHDGRIMPVFEERLRQMGEWLAVNGEAIYGSAPWIHQNDTLAKNIWYTRQKTANGGTAVYCIMLVWPDNNVLQLGAPPPTTGLSITMLGYQGLFKWTPLGGAAGIQIQIPAISALKLPSRWAWVFKLIYPA